MRRDKGNVMKQFQILLAGVLIGHLLSACSDGGSGSAWNQVSNAASSTANPSQLAAMSVILNSSSVVPAANVSQTISANVTGGVAPYKYIFSYSSNGVSNCAVSTILTSPQATYPCSFSFASAGLVSVSVTDANGAVASSPVLTIAVNAPNPVPNPPPVLPPSPTPPPITCAPTQVALTCLIRVVCPDGITTASFGDSADVVALFNPTGKAGDVDQATTANLTLQSASSPTHPGAHYSNLEGFGGGYNFTCSASGAWAGSGPISCRIDIAVNTPLCPGFQ